MSERIKAGDSVKAAIIKMSDRNFGALNVLMTLVEDERGFLALLHLDSFGIYGSDIWLGFKDVCGQDQARFTRAIFLAALGQCDLKAAIAEEGNGPASDKVRELTS